MSALQALELEAGLENHKQHKTTLLKGVKKRKAKRMQARNTSATVIAESDDRLLPFNKHPLSESVWTADLTSLPLSFQKAYDSQLAAKRASKR